MAEETKKDEDSGTVPEAPATGADAPETAGADVAPEGESAVTAGDEDAGCLLYTSPSPRDKRQSRMPSSA